MDYEKQLFEKSKMKAPADFKAKTMRYINQKQIEENEKNTAKIEYSFFKLGQICVAAALLLFVVNIFPAANKIVYGLDNDTIPPQHESIMEKASDKYNEFTQWIDETIDFDFFKQKDSTN